MVRLLYGQTRIDGLRVHDGWSCNVGRCTTVSTNQDVIRQRCSRAHRLKVKTAGIVSRVTIQTVFLQKPRYFIVIVMEIDLQRLLEQFTASSPPTAPVDAAFASLRQ